MNYGGEKMCDQMAHHLADAHHSFFSEVDKFLVRYVKEEVSSNLHGLHDIEHAVIYSLLIFFIILRSFIFVLFLSHSFIFLFFPLHPPQTCYIADDLQDHADRLHQDPDAFAQTVDLTVFGVKPSPSGKQHALTSL